ncbi:MULTISPECIES: type IV pilus twitching motility protein PilT [Nostocales]|uniref:Flp pilus assembly complex ATPase component TadA n=3 Tax=Nostocales TaxID=1161 RepID=A0A0C1NBJ6_9CYAN|nr:ATPase, T2SS/T4P/T4SS family [Tolypothrix bouteillei]KAF3890515.1 Flp pilus assembly complex ATPase component TadA [Tolypothrix bouteillei VB521301]
MTTGNVNNLEILTLEQFLNNAQIQQALDVHIAIGDVPYFRIKGILKASSDSTIDELKFWTWAETVFNVDEIQQIKSGSPLQIFHQYPFGNVSVSCFLTLQGAVMAIRFLPLNIPTFEKLGIPVALKNICQHLQGLILVTGEIGSGKTTTLASLVDYLNREMSRKIFIIEEAVTYVHQNHQSLINHWVVGTHTPNIVEGVLTALKNDADVIVLNELSDRSTVDVALRAARSGTLVLACLHTSRAIAAIQELFTLYSTQEQDFIRFRLADSLKAILSQRLVSTLSGDCKRTAIFELLLTTDVVRSHILEGRVQHLLTLMQQGQDRGMSTLEVELQKLLQSERITQEIFAETLQKLTF